MVGVPEMVPVVGSMARPGGRPVAVHPVMVPPPSTVAVGVSGVMAVPEVEVWSPGLVTVTTSWTVQLNEVLVPLKASESVAVTVTEYVPPVVGVPEMIPEETPMARPGGAPFSEKLVMVAPPPAPDVVAGTVIGVMAVPTVEDWSPGAVTVTTLSMTMVTGPVPVNPAESVAWTVIG